MPYLLFITVMRFITNRIYKLKCEGKVRNYQFKVDSSVPQGSHCGPPLFIIMSMDIVKCIEESTVQMLIYADDVKIYNTVNDDISRIELQKCIDKLFEWSVTNRLTLNKNETQHVTYFKNRTTTLKIDILTH